jgi:predicted chitinase
MNARNREEEYLRRMKALGYEPSLNGMDDEDIEWELSKMEEADRRRAAEWQQPEQPVRTVYRPVDPGLKARILRQFGQPHDESAIPKGQEFYLNGWDNGEDEDEVRTLVSQREQRKQDFNAPDFDPWKNAWKLDWGEDGNPLAGPQKMDHWPRRDGAMFPSRGDTFRPLSYTAGGNDVNTGGRGTNTAAANTNAGGYADGGAEGDMLFGVTGVTPQQPKQYVSADQLKAFGWQNVDDKMVRDLNDALIKYEITTPARIRHFLSQAAKESDMGRSTLEYGDDDYWNDNGYGRKYRGAGYIQMTWPDAYEKFAKEVNDDDVMEKGAEYVAQKYPWQASAYWWHKLNQMNDLVDEFDDADTDADVEKVTRIVNGTPDWNNSVESERWKKSLRERQEHYKRSKENFRD